MPSEQVHLLHCQNVGNADRFDALRHVQAPYTPLLFIMPSFMGLAGQNCVGRAISCCVGVACIYGVLQIELQARCLSLEGYWNFDSTRIMVHALQFQTYFFENVNSLYVRRLLCVCHGEWYPGLQCWATGREGKDRWESSVFSHPNMECMIISKI